MWLIISRAEFNKNGSIVSDAIGFGQSSRVKRNEKRSDSMKTNTCD